MIRAWTGLVIILAALLAFAVARAEDPQLSVSIVPDGELTVGDPVEVQVTITHQPGDRVLMDGSVVQMGGMEPSAPVITELSQTETMVVFQTRAFGTATFEVGLPRIPMRRADGTLTELTPRPVSITITSVLGAESEPRPITAARPPPGRQPHIHALDRGDHRNRPRFRPGPPAAPTLPPPP